MFRSLITNTLISGFAFVVSALVPLLLVPLLIGRFGILEYGLIVIARILLPNGTLAIFDFGNSEIATQSVAQARHDGDWARAGRRLRSLARFTLLIGLAVAIALASASPWIATLFKVPQSAERGFELVVVTTSITFPLLLSALIGDGVLKGFEAFRRLRFLDVSNAAMYGLAALLIVWCGYPYHYVALAFVVTTTARSLAVLFLAHRLLRARDVAFDRPTAEDSAEVRSRGTVMAANRLVSAAQSQATPVVISTLLGPAAVGVYDVVTRVPRFLKVITGIMNSAVLPLASRLDAASNAAGIRRLGEIGLLGVTIAAAPICAWGVVFSEPLLRTWIGAPYSQFWFWQSMMFIVPLVNTLTSFGGGALLGRTHVVARLNAIALTQVILQYAIGVACMRWYGERAFILGQCVAMTLTFPLTMRIIAREKQIPWAAFGRIVALVAALLVATTLSLLAGVDRLVHNPFGLLASLAIWNALVYALIWFALLRSAERRAILSMLPLRRGAH